MNDEKKYKEALEKLQEALAPKNGCEISGLTKGCIEEIFPELKESEDDRIRKHLISLVKNWDKDGIVSKYTSDPNDIKQILEWLEKQEISYTKKDIDDAYLNGINDAKNEIKKQHEANYQIRKDIATFIFNYRGDIKDRAKWMNYLDIKISFIEKQDNQKPQSKTAFEAIKEKPVDNANKVKPNYKPKFNIADWVVWDNKISCHIDNIYQGEESLMYAITDTNNMIRTYSVKDFDRNAYLWTIQDAKEGDILCGFPEDDYPWIGIFCKLSNKDNFSSYCYLQAGRNGKFCPPSGKNIFGNRNVDDHSSYKVFPATKEQCDKLFKAMADAGYTFDFDKKELKKIEKPTAWSQEDERMMLSIEQIMNCASLLNIVPQKIDKVRTWLKSIKERIE